MCNGSADPGHAARRGNSGRSSPVIAIRIRHPMIAKTVANRNKETCPGGFRTLAGPPTPGQVGPDDCMLLLECFVPGRLNRLQPFRRWHPRGHRRNPAAPTPAPRAPAARRGAGCAPGASPPARQRLRRHPARSASWGRTYFAYFVNRALMRPQWRLAMKLSMYAARFGPSLW